MLEVFCADTDKDIHVLNSTCLEYRERYYKLTPASSLFLDLGNGKGRLIKV